MAITVKDIHEKEFSKQVRGYSIDEVDDFLDELAEQMEAMIKENREALQLLRLLRPAQDGLDVDLADQADFPLVVRYMMDSAQI